VDLQRELRGLQDQVHLAARTIRGRQQLDRLLRDRLRVAGQIEPAHHLVAAGLHVAERLRVATPLRLVLPDGGGVHPAAGLDQVLVDAVPLRGHEPLVGVPEHQVRGRDRHPVDVRHRARGADDDRDLLVERHGEGVLGMGRLVAVLGHRHVRELQAGPGTSADALAVAVASAPARLAAVSVSSEVAAKPHDEPISARTRRRRPRCA
jgi:hypothetical protein